VTPSLAERVAAHEQWYHTMELAPGVVTPGWFDTRGARSSVPLRARLDGMRCLDVGTFDGFWAFEMERRGAAEVVAIDVLDVRRADWPVTAVAETIERLERRHAQGSGFEIAADALGSRVKRLDLSVYELDPMRVGTFDVVYLGSLLIHLRDPVSALERVRAVCRGELVCVDAYDVGLTLLHPRRPVAALDGIGRPWWWEANLAGLQRMIESAGFRVVGRPRRFLMPPGLGQPKGGLRLRELRHRAGREAALHARKGDPHAAFLARPV
jgi:tRNA (mo5U34)-methyltransferase